MSNQMNKYTIYCTVEQTKKALELGAPLFRLYGTGCSDYIDMLVISDTEAYTIPTTDQMIGWLDDKSIQVTIRFRGNSWYYDIMSGYNVLSVGKDVSTRKEATLTAIDAALEYLENNKNVNQ